MGIIPEAEKSTDTDLEGKDQLGKRNRDDSTPTAEGAGLGDAFSKMQRRGSPNEDSDSAMDTQSVHSTATRTMNNTNQEQKDAIAIVAPEYKAAMASVAPEEKAAMASMAAELQAYREEDGDQVSVASQGTWKTERSIQSHMSQISARRESDRQIYSSMSRDERKAYNAKRRDQYHRQSHESRQKLRERERNRYHAGMVRSDSDVKDRNKRRAKLGRGQFGREEVAAASGDSALVTASTSG